MALLNTRQTLILLLWLCDICLYMARTNVSVAVASMFPSDSSEGSLLSAFYWGYMLFQIPAGWLASRFGGSPVLVMAVVVWSVASAASCFTSGNLPALFALRVVVGCAESCTYPSMSQLASVWFPYEERGTCWAVITTGESIGTILMLLGGPFLVDSFGWRSVFLSSGALGLVWVLVYVAAGFAVASDPAKHRSISAAELAHIQASRPPRPPLVSTPWRRILTNRPFIATICCHCLYNWTFYIGLSWVDKFFKSAWPETPTATLAVASVVPYAALFVCGSSSGFVADKLESRAGLSPTATRKLINSVGFLGGAAGFFALSFIAPTGGSAPARASIGAATICLSVAIGIAGFGAAAGYWATFADLSPRHGALLLAISNAFASAPGIIGNTFTGNLLQSTKDDWSAVFQISAGTLVLGAFFYLGSEARDQHFDTPRVGSLNTKLLDVAVDDADCEAAGVAGGGAASSSGDCDGENITPPPTYRPD